MEDNSCISLNKKGKTEILESGNHLEPQNTNNCQKQPYLACLGFLSMDTTLGKIHLYLPNLSAGKVWKWFPSGSSSMSPQSHPISQRMDFLPGAPPTPQRTPGGDRNAFLFIGITGTFPEDKAFSSTFPGAFPGQSDSAEWLLSAGAPGSPQGLHQQHLEGIKPIKHIYWLPSLHPLLGNNL